MANNNSPSGKDLGKFAFYMVAIALTVAALFWLLTHARPTIAPKVKNTPGNSQLFHPSIPAPGTAVLRTAG